MDMCLINVFIIDINDAGIEAKNRHIRVAVFDGEKVIRQNLIFTTLGFI